jgi:pilus assembly protein CpaC
VPILGALFRSTDFQQERTELVFVITARLVKPLPAGSLSLPTDRFDAPSRAGVLLGGRLEGTPAVGTAPVPPAPAPAAGGPEPE